MTSHSPAQPIQLYRTALSGHCHRVELFMALLGLPCELIDIDMRAGQHKTPEFLAMNIFGQVPVLRDGDVLLADSNAMLVYLAARYAPEPWWPRDPLQLAHIQRWLSVAAGQVAFGPARARMVKLFKAPWDGEAARALAHTLFAVMEQHLQSQAGPFLLGAQPSLADIANYSYIAHAPEGGVSLDAYPALRQWLAHIENLPRFVPMPRSAVA